MRLFLGSSGLGALAGFLGDDLRGGVAAYVPTAAKRLDDADFVEKDVRHLEELGFTVGELDVAAATREEIGTALAQAQLVFVDGGPVFYLLQQVRQSGFGELLTPVVRSGTPYVGMSAGALLVGPSLEPFSPVTREQIPDDLASFETLGLVDAVVLPHYETNEERYAPVLADFGQTYRLVPLRDDQALIVEDGDYRVVASP